MKKRAAPSNPLTARTSWAAKWSLTRPAREKTEVVAIVAKVAEAGAATVETEVDGAVAEGATRQVPHYYSGLSISK
jgi:hypothetical protein